jgi:cell division protein FtsB
MFKLADNWPERFSKKAFRGGKRNRRVTFAVWLASAILLMGTSARGQEATAGASDELQNEIRTLSETVRQLQAQVQSLNSQLSDLQAKEQNRDSNGVLVRASSIPATNAAANALNDPYLTFPARTAVAGASNTAPASAAPARTLEQRMSQLEDDEDLTDSKLADQNQTKVESGSKYRLRLSGIVLVNMFENRGTVDNADFPEIALEPDALDSAGTFGGSLRQSQIGLQVFGPDVAGARTSADVKFDFAGGFPNAPNGTVLGLVRLRTGTVRLDWSNTSIVAGQDFLFFSPLAPTSLAQFAIPALSYAGNLWAWAPQVRIEHRIHFSDSSSLLVAGGILDSLSGDLPYSTYERYPSWGEESGQPAYAGRLAWSQRVFGQNLTLGTGGYYGRQYWGFGRHVDGWAGTADMSLPLGKYFGLTAQFYRGRALGGLGGGIGQDVVIGGSILSPVQILGLDSVGGWAQLKFKPWPKFEINGALGIDNPFASELRRFPTTDSYYGVSLSKNVSPFVNFIYQLRSDVLFSLEYRYLKTYMLDDEAYSANHINLSLGYIF